jgi:hypothetical protein
MFRYATGANVDMFLRTFLLTFRECSFAMEWLLASCLQSRHFPTRSSEQLVITSAQRVRQNERRLVHTWTSESLVVLRCCVTAQVWTRLYSDGSDQFTVVSWLTQALSSKIRFPETFGCYFVRKSYRSGKLLSKH